jgi:Glycine-rich domain-containing protein-like
MMETLPSTDVFAAFLPSAAGQHMNTQQHMLVAFDDKFSTIKPLIDIPAHQRHLVYLNAVLQLFKSVDDNFVIKDPTNGMKSPSRPTRVFLSKALYRYHAWITKCLRGRKGNDALKQEEVPPMDVLVVHHAHMLAPWRYAEDVRLRFPELRNAGRFPLDILVRNISIPLDQLIQCLL